MYFNSLIWQFLLNLCKRPISPLWISIILFSIVISPYFSQILEDLSVKCLSDNLSSKSSPYKETFVCVLARQDCGIKEVGRILLHRLNTYRHNTICSIIYWPLMIALEAIFLLSKSNKILSLLWDLWGQIILILFKLIWRISRCNSF